MPSLEHIYSISKFEAFPTSRPATEQHRGSFEGTARCPIAPETTLLAGRRDPGKAHQEQDSAERHRAVAGEPLAGSAAGHPPEADRAGQGVPLPVQPAEEGPAAADDLVEEPQRRPRHHALPEGVSAGRKEAKHSFPVEFLLIQCIRF